MFSIDFVKLSHSKLRNNVHSQTTTNQRHDKWTVVIIPALGRGISTAFRPKFPSFKLDPKSSTVEPNKYQF